MAVSQEIQTEVGTLHLRVTGVDDGDFGLSADVAEFAERRASLIDLPWTWLRQVHGNVVYKVTTPGQFAGQVGDGAATSTAGAVLSALTADCAPVVLVGTMGFAVVHAGWRGVEAGVIAEAGDLLRTMGAEPVTTVLGPCIQPAEYEFGYEELDRLKRLFGSGVVSATTTGLPALDMPELVAAGCEQAHWPPPEHNLVLEAEGRCTSGTAYFSHRTRADKGRQATVGWLEQ